MNIEIHDIPHWHGLTLKKGITDAILETENHKNTFHDTHSASYLKGYEIGETLREMISKKVS